MVEPKSINVESFGQQKTHVGKHIEIPELNATYPLVVKLLEEGNLPVVGCYKGQKRVVARISESAFNIDKLLRTHGVLEYYDDSGKCTTLNNIVDYLEVL